MAILECEIASYASRERPPQNEPSPHVAPASRAMQSVIRPWYAYLRWYITRPKASTNPNLPLAFFVFRVHTWLGNRPLGRAINLNRPLAGFNLCTAR